MLWPGNVEDIIVQNVSKLKDKSSSVKPKICNIHQRKAKQGAKTEDLFHWLIIVDDNHDQASQNKVNSFSANWTVIAGAASKS